MGTNHGIRRDGRHLGAFVPRAFCLSTQSKKREEKYTATITGLTEGLNALEGIKQDIKSIIDTIDATVQPEDRVFAKRKRRTEKSEQNQVSDQ